MALADAELKCKKLTKGAKAPPADKSPRDSKCGAEKEGRSDRHIRDLSE